MNAEKKCSCTRKITSCNSRVLYKAISTLYKNLLLVTLCGQIWRIYHAKSLSMIFSFSFECRQTYTDHHSCQLVHPTSTHYWLFLSDTVDPVPPPTNQWH